MRKIVIIKIHFDFSEMLYFCIFVDGFCLF